MSKKPSDKQKQQWIETLNGLVRAAGEARDAGDRLACESRLAAALEFTKAVPPLEASGLDVEAIWVTALVHLGDEPAALRRLAAATETARARGDEVRLLRFAFQKIALEQQKIPPEQTLRALSQLAEQWEARGDAAQAAAIQVHRATMVARIGRLTDALDLATTALQQLDPAKQRMELVEAILLCCALTCTIGRPGDAVQWLARLQGAQLTLRQGLRVAVMAVRISLLSGATDATAQLHTSFYPLDPPRDLRLQGLLLEAGATIRDGHPQVADLLAQCRSLAEQDGEWLDVALLTAEAALWLPLAEWQTPDTPVMTEPEALELVAAQTWEAAEKLPDPLPRAAVALATCALSLRQGKPVSVLALRKQADTMRQMGALDLAWTSDALADLAQQQPPTEALAQLAELGLGLRHSWLTRLAKVVIGDTM